ncbi:MAG: UDP-glucuronosyltransferase-like glycosyl transferase [Bacteroidetes bacterium]|nr:MAG: UDP-glucuronosyltransferase-like glycosyl transferase [Bacteroidota bacterium]
MDLKIMFIVQGEGRGHMTQAISLKQLLNRNGCTVCSVLVGSSSAREVPDFFLKSMEGVSVSRFLSPNFVTRNSRAIRIMPTVIYNLQRLRTYRKSIREIENAVNEHKPDLIINFYDPLAGLFCFLKRPKTPMIAVAHQYLAEHPGFPFPKGYAGDKFALKAYTNLTAWGSKRKLALSFYETDDLERKNVLVVPPLLRNEVFEQAASNGGYFLVYLVNKGYRDDILNWHRENPQVTLHCFTDNKDITDVMQVDETLFFHQLNDRKFLSMMAGARGLISTAGFESICEAMYLGKPAFMVPVEGHFEQLCNSRDAHLAGAGIYDKSFNIGRFLDYLPQHREIGDKFRNWVHRAEEKFMASIMEVIHESSGEY